jgi:hypothetical protein
MIGFEIKVNNEVPLKIVSNNSQLFITVIENNVFMLMSGTDFSYNLLKWPNKKLKIGDKVNVKVKDIQLATKPFEIREEDISYIKERYFRFKAELEHRGLI